jgi:hypothetical protein
MNKAADTMFDEVADKVMEEDEEGHEGHGVGEQVMVHREEEQERVQGAAGIKQQVRASPRLQRSRDEHILAKAEERVAKKNLEFQKGNPCSTSLLSVNKDLALNCLQQIGLNLGKSSLEKEFNYFNLLDLESQREEGEFEEWEQEWEDFESEVESVEDLERNVLKNLCGDLMEEVFDESSFPLNSELDDFSRKGKSHAKSCLKKTCKIGRAKFFKKGAK